MREAEFMASLDGQMEAARQVLLNGAAPDRRTQRHLMTTVRWTKRSTALQQNLCRDFFCPRFRHQDPDRGQCDDSDQTKPEECVRAAQVIGDISG